MSLTFLWTILLQVIFAMSNNLLLITIVPRMMPMALDFLSKALQIFVKHFYSIVHVGFMVEMIKGVFVYP
jgi:hypothetical protein